MEPRYWEALTLWSRVVFMDENEYSLNGFDVTDPYLPAVLD